MGYRQRRRFTPARAGNTGDVGSGEPATTVHPCAGREHAFNPDTDTYYYGSPLRGQGTLEHEKQANRHVRFTPARAGNTTVDDAHPLIGAVHPCAGREHV